MIAVTNDGWDGFAGSGFGHKCFVNDKQYYCWLGKEIERTAFEIAVSDGPLDPQEKAILVGPSTTPPPLAPSELKRSPAPAKVAQAGSASVDSSKFSARTYESIQNGMTEDEVLQILGPTNNSATKRITTGGQTTTTRKLAWRQTTPNVTITVTFRNGVVAGKNRIEINPVKK